MDDAALGRAVRMLRHRRGWRQVDLASRAGVSAGLVGLLERGRADRLTVRAVRSICRTMDLAIAWDAGQRGFELIRLRDADHAALGERTAELLQGAGWETASEVSFNHYGDRGRIDLVAFHARTATILVCEMKTVIVDIQELLGTLDVKCRNARRAVAPRAWAARRVIPCLVVADGSTNRRRIAMHARLFNAFPLRGRSARTWVRQPHVPAPAGMLLFDELPDRNGVDARRAGRQRIRRSRAQRA